MSTREFFALRDVQQAPARRWAAQQAMTANMNLKEGAEPFTLADFLGTGDRDKRSMKRALASIEIARENKKLLSMKPRKKGESEPEWLPDWAKSEAPQREA